VKRNSIQDKGRSTDPGTHYEDYRHPNMMSGVSKDFVKPRQTPNTDRSTGTTSDESSKGCLYFFRKFDDQILRPIFIHKYKIVKHKPEVNFEQVLRETE